MYCISEVVQPQWTSRPEGPAAVQLAAISCAHPCIRRFLIRMTSENGITEVRWHITCYLEIQLESKQQQAPQASRSTGTELEERLETTYMYAAILLSRSPDSCFPGLAGMAWLRRQRGSVPRTI